MFADDIVEINKGKVSMWKMSAQPFRVNGTPQGGARVAEKA